MIDTALSWEEGEMKDALVFTIANHMKKCYLNWNKDTVDDEAIFRHLTELSGGKLRLRTMKSFQNLRTFYERNPINRIVFRKVTRSRVKRIIEKDNSNNTFR